METEEELKDIFGEDFKLIGAKFLTKSKVLKLLVLCSKNMLAPPKVDIANKIKDKLNLEIEYKIDFQEELTQEQIVSEINKLTCEYKIGNNILFSQCECKKKNNENLLIVTVFDSKFDKDKLKDIQTKIECLIEKNTIEKYTFIFNYNEENCDELLDERDSFLYQGVDDLVIDENPYYQVDNIDVIYGSHITNKAQKIYSIKEEEKGVLIAGKVSYFKENYYKPKESTNEEEMKIRYNFDIEDFTGKLRAVFFPPKMLIEKGTFDINDGDSIICYGDVSSYNERLSIRVKDIARCTLPEFLFAKEENKMEEKENDEVEVKEYITEVEENYKTVSPKPYVEEAQMDFFTMQQVPPKNIMDKEYVVFDLETTGFEPSYCDIIEIGAVKICKGQIVESFTTLVRPRTLIPAEITELTGINDDMVVFAPVFEEVVADFYKFTRNCILVAHNANFDINFLRYHADKLNYNFNNEYLDTLAMARENVKGVKNYKLKTLTEYFQVRLVDAHRALNDTVATAKVFIELKRLEDKK